MFVFELLHCDKKSLLHEPLHIRLAKLRSITKVTGDIFKDTLILSPQDILKDKEHLELSFDDALSRGLEGIMIKKSDGFYQPGARGFNWIKYKRSQSTKIDDTIDCVVMGYDKGKGKRTNFGIGAFLVGVYNDEKDMFETVAKIGTGLTDDEWRELHRRCSTIQSTHKPALYDVDTLMNVDIWVLPEIIVEIKADEITRSPTHTAGRVLKESKSGKAFDVEEPGYALRFPRLRQFRDDKKPEDATSLSEVKEIFSQVIIVKSGE
jgi:DNA ligase-1